MKARLGGMRGRRKSRTIAADGGMLPVAVNEHPRATRLTLRIVPGGGSLRLTVPPYVSERQIDEFLLRNQRWAQTRIARLPSPIAVHDGATIPFLGLPHRIVRVDRLRGIVERTNVDGHPVLRVPGAAPALGRRLRSFLQKEARIRLADAVTHHAAQIGVRPRLIRVADTASRWGSCSTNRTLSFSWRIVMAPEAVLDYLAAHETAHLRHMNHGAQFWALVEQFCPQMDRHKSWLRRNGARLHAVRFD